uniref:RH1 domain-containing protein n=1 Tax=Hucho hucho TaxID=62062 RepID=A0A4W5MSG5_9TELE
MECGESILCGSGELDLDPDIVSEEAGKLYSELQTVIETHGVGVVESLVPILVWVLEGLASCRAQLREREEEAEREKGERDELLERYQSEKLLRRESQERYLELDDQIEQERRMMRGREKERERREKDLEKKAREQADQLVALEEQRAGLSRELNTLKHTHNKVRRQHVRLTRLFGTQRLCTLLSVTAAVHHWKCILLSPLSLLLSFFSLHFHILSLSQLVLSYKDLLERKRDLERAGSPLSNHVRSNNSQSTQGQSESCVSGQELTDRRPETPPNSVLLEEPVTKDDRVIDIVVKPDRDAFFINDIISSTPELAKFHGLMKASTPVRADAKEPIRDETKTSMVEEIKEVEEKKGEKEDEEEDMDSLEWELRNTESVFSELSELSREYIESVDQGASVRGSTDQFEEILSQYEELKHTQ